MHHRVAELDELMLDRAVALAAGLTVYMRHPAGWVTRNVNGTDTQWQPSRSWHQAGPIIESTGIDLEWAPNNGCSWYEPDGDMWCALAPTRDGLNRFTGATPLIAAMRAYVAAKLGDEIDLP